MSGSNSKKLRKIAKSWAKQEMTGNILIYQGLDFKARARIAWAILFKRGDGSPKARAK